jgi:hypothetical protein
MEVIMAETATQRRARDVEAQSEDRKTRNYYSQPQERLEREYVDGATTLWTYVDSENE